MYFFVDRFAPSLPPVANTAPCFCPTRGFGNLRFLSAPTCRTRIKTICRSFLHGSHVRDTLDEPCQFYYSCYLPRTFTSTWQLQLRPMKFSKCCSKPNTGNGMWQAGPVRTFDDYQQCSRRQKSYLSDELMSTKNRDQLILIFLFLCVDYAPNAQSFHSIP